MWVDPEDDPRSEGGFDNERDLLVNQLRDYRLTFEMNCSGLTPAQLAERSVEPSTMSLLGLVQHLAGVEHVWFRTMIAGDDSPRPFRTPTTATPTWSTRPGPAGARRS